MEDKRINNSKTLQEFKIKIIKEFCKSFEQKCIKGGIYPAFIKRQLYKTMEEFSNE